MENKAEDLMVDLLCDPTLKREFIIDPKKVLREKGFKVEDNVEYKVVEDTKSIRYITIPYVKEGMLPQNETLEKRKSKSFWTCPFGIGGCPFG